MFIILKNKLFILAGIVWCFAGFMVSRIGIRAFINKNSILIIVLAIIIYMLFHLRVFTKLVKKHESRIMTNSLLRLPWYHFFDKQGYIVMVCMITFGIVLRKSNIMPQSFFAFFYTGLGLALFTSGLHFLYLFYKHRKFIE